VQPNRAIAGDRRDARQGGDSVTAEKYIFVTNKKAGKIQRGLSRLLLLTKMTH